MAHISRLPLEKGQETILNKQLCLTIAKLDTTSTTHFLGEFFGAEEQLMFAKRLAAIFMCSNGDSAYKIWNTLKISPSTAERIRDNYRDGHYKEIESILKRHPHDSEQFFKTLEKILNFGMSPRGKGRWDRVTKLLTEK